MNYIKYSISVILFLLLCVYSQVLKGQVIGKDGVIYTKDSVVIPYVSGDGGNFLFAPIYVPIAFVDNRMVHLKEFRSNTKIGLFKDNLTFFNRKPTNIKEKKFIWYYQYEEKKNLQDIKNIDALDLSEKCPVGAVSYSRWSLVGYNALFPGWGTSQVTGNNKYYWVGRVGYALLAGTFATRLAYAYTYQKYKNSPMLYSTYGKHDLYKRSVFLHQLFYTELICASAIWAEQLVQGLLYVPSNKYKTPKNAKRKIAFAPTYSPMNNATSASFNLTF